MAQAMNLSEITPISMGQIAKCQELIAAALRQSGLPKEPVQQVIMSPQGGVLADEFVASLRRRVEAISELIIRHIRKVPTRTNREVINATGRAEYIENDVLEAMPRGGKEEEDIFFFPIKRTASPAEVQAAYDRHNLEPDPEGVAKANEDDPSFADKHPNACQWKDDLGRWSYVSFFRWSDGERFVGVYRNAYVWHGRWFFGGRRKNALEPSGAEDC